MKESRLYFIDAIRAFAILMMLQGHFIDGLLNPIYKSTAYPAFHVWEYFRGNTAPLFFTISGLIVMLLLLKAKEKRTEHIRIKKGVKRGVTLILLGYALRIPFFQWLSGSFNTYFLVVDVLQIIGLSLIGLNCIFYLLKSKTAILTALLFSLGTTIFLTEPLYRTIAFPNLPLAISNYLSKSNGSVFTIFPWFGYICYGAFIAIIFQHFKNKKQFKRYTIFSFSIIGLLLIFVSSPALSTLSQITSINLFEAVSVYNYLFLRLGNVLLIFAIFYTFESYLKHPIISKLGSNTLSIYVIHFIILYGSFIGIGLYRFLNNKLEPWPAISGAFLFIIVVSVIALNEDKIKAFLNIVSRKAAVFLKLETLKRLKLNRR